MRKLKLFTLLFLGGIVAVSQVAGQKKTAKLELTTVELADAEKIRAHVKFLSSDLLEGRGTGQRGGDIAAEYIATQFALDGLKPAGDDGTFFQRVPLMAVHTIEEKTKFALVPASGAAMDLSYGTDVVSKDQTGQATADIDAPIV